MEIEKKYLIKNIPFDPEAYEHHEIAQGYISVRPVIRIRKSDDTYILTIKGKGLSMREEYELFISSEEFNELSKKVSGNVIEKTRYKIPDPVLSGNPKNSGLTIELDVFHGLFEGLIYAEVEFPDPETMQNYNLPVFSYKEVTNNPIFSNSYLSNMSSDSAKNFMQMALCWNQDLQ